MKRILLAACIMAALQIVVGLIAFKLILGDCSGVGLGGFSCSGPTELWPFAIIAALIIPAIMVKWASPKLKLGLTWGMVVWLDISLAVVVPILVAAIASLLSGRFS